MKRKVYHNLLKWKTLPGHKPLLVIGARQVGKTHTISEFCKNEYDSVAIVNLLDNKEIVNIFHLSINTEEKYIKLKALLDIDIEKENSIVFFDEIQESQELISSLKFFHEQHPEVNIICAGSLLGVKLKRFHSSFPVGKVDYLNMYPMNFEEYLMAFRADFLIEEIRKSFNANQKLVEPFHTMALGYFRLYLCTGGMPEAVKNIILVKKDITKFDVSIISNITNAYFEDMNQYVVNKNEAIKLRKVYESIPSQLSNESKKFQYNKVEKNAKKRGYELPIDWLLANRLLFQSIRVSTPQIPLKGFLQNEFFKLFLGDIGILTKMLDLRYGDILTNNLSQYKGAIVENYVALEFVSNEIPLFYWLSNYTAEIDFLLYKTGSIIPVEAKAGDNVKSKSLKTYVEKFQPNYSIRISTKNFGFNNNIQSVPLYAVFCITDD